MHAVVHHYEEGPQGVIVHYDRTIEDRIQRVEDLLREKYPDLTNLRWHAIKMLEYDKEVMKDHPIEFESIVPETLEKEIINEKYDYVESVVNECLFNKEEKSQMTDRVDRLLTHPGSWNSGIFRDHGTCIFPDVYRRRFPERLL